MELDLENEFADRAYPILASLVTPRPIALVTTVKLLKSQFTAPGTPSFNAGPTRFHWAWSRHIPRGLARTPI